MKVRLLFAIAALGLSGCTTTDTPEPRIVVQPVDRPVPVSCVPGNLAAPPDYPDTDEALTKATPEGRYQLVIAGRDLRRSRLGEVEPVIEKCRVASEGNP